MEKNKRTTKKSISVVITALVRVLFTVGAFLRVQYNEEARLDRIQAETLAERFDAKLRIIKSERFATLTLPEGVSMV